MTAIIKFTKEIKKPTRATRLSVGLDFYTPEYVKILPGKSVSIHLGFDLKPPPNHFTILKERSSLALRGLIGLGGVIDPDYEGELVFIIHNLTDKVIFLHKGEKIGQIIFLKTTYPKILTIKVFGATTDSNLAELQYLREERGTKGLGSSNEGEFYKE